MQLVLFMVVDFCFCMFGIVGSVGFVCGLFAVYCVALLLVFVVGVHPREGMGPGSKWLGPPKFQNQASEPLRWEQPKRATTTQLRAVLVCAGSVRDGLGRAGLVDAELVGAGLVCAGLVRAGLACVVRAGPVRAGLVRAGGRRRRRCHPEEFDCRMPS